MKAGVYTKPVHECSREEPQLKTGSNLNVHELMNGYAKRVPSKQQNIIWQGIRTNEVLTRAMTWLNFQNIMLSERRQSLMTNDRGFHVYETPKLEKL